MASREGLVEDRQWAGLENVLHIMMGGKEKKGAGSQEFYSRSDGVD